MSRFYVKATSDTGKGTVTKGGNRELQVEITVDSPQGRSMIKIDCSGLPFGESTVKIKKRAHKDVKVIEG